MKLLPGNNSIFQYRVDDVIVNTNNTFKFLNVRKTRQKGKWTEALDSKDKAFIFKGIDTNRKLIKVKYFWSRHSPLLELPLENHVNGWMLYKKYKQLKDETNK